MAIPLGTMTVLLYDIVDSTALRRDLGDADAERLFRSLDGAVASAAEQLGGDFAKGTGDGQLLGFASAAAALQASLRVHRLAAANGVTTRIGISAGDLRRDDADVYGTPAAEAARLCDAAPPGATYVADVVRVLAGSWSAVELTPLGPHEFKGLGAPLEVWSLALPDDAQDLDEPVLAVDEEFAFVGRRHELSTLDDIWATTAAGTTQAALLAGEPGAGKSRLALEFSRRLPPTATVLAARFDREAPFSLGPLLDAVASRLSDDLVTELGPHRHVLARYLPGIVGGREDPHSMPGDEEFRLAEAVRLAVTSLTAHGPVLLILDDAQWAGDAARQLITRMLRTVGRLMLLATYRDTIDDLEPEAAEWLASLASQRWARRLPIAGLQLDDVEEMASAALGPERGAEAAATIFAQANGHGFFTAELLRQLIRSGDTSMPSTVADVITLRLGRLDQTVSDLLSAASLIGLSFELGLAAAVADLPEARALEAIEAAIEARLVLERPGDRLQFAHALIPAALSENLSTARRLRAHRDIAAWLERRGDQAADRALHLIRAVPVVDVGRALDAAMEAGREATDAHRHDTAAVLYGEALTLDVDDRTKADLLIRQGTAWNFTGRVAHAAVLFQEAAELAERHGWPEVLARAALGFWGDDPWRDNRAAAAVDLLERAMEHRDALPPHVSAQLAAQRAAMSLFRMPLDARMSLTERAWSVVADHPDPEVRFSVFQSHWVAIACPAMLDRLHVMLPTLTDLQEQIQFRHVPGAAVEEVVHAWAADGGAYRRFLTEIRRSERPTRDIDLWRWSTMEAVLALAVGDVEEARRLADRSLLFGADVWNDSAHGVHGFLHIHAAHLAGEPLAARQLVTALNDRTGGPIFGLLDAWLAALEGDMDFARATLARIGPQRLKRLPEFFLGSAALIGGAGAAIATGDEPAMRALLEGFAPYSGQMAGVPWASYLAIAHHAGELAAALGDRRRAEALFDEAMAVEHRFGAPAQVAISRQALESLRS